MLKKFNKRIPKKVYKILGQVHGTGISYNEKQAYYRARFLLGMNAKAMNADVVLHTHYSNPVVSGKEITVTYSGTAIKITNPEFYKKLQKETDN